MAVSQTDTKLLLVEGIDDKYVVGQLCERHEYTGKFGILDKEGFPNLKAAIGPETKVSGRVALGILVDANDNPAGRWDEIVHQLRSAGFDPPLDMVSTGTIIISSSGGGPRVGIWLMPDNGTAGQLEDFIQGLIPNGDRIWPLAANYIDTIPNGDRKFKPQKVQRARIHAWLAAREEPRKMGAAIRARDLDANAQPATEFMMWLRRLFD